MFKTNLQTKSIILLAQFYSFENSRLKTTLEQTFDTNHYSLYLLEYLTQVQFHTKLKVLFKLSSVCFSIDDLQRFGLIHI